MFSGKFDLKKERDGSVFIDRSGEHFNYILNFLRGNICSIDDFLFDENTRKSLIKEAEFYQLDRMKNILTFKSNTLASVDDSKQEVINIIKKVIDNKEALEDVLRGSGCTRRRQKQMEPSDLQLQKTYDKLGILVVQKTRKEMEFEDAHWDHLQFEKVRFLHNIRFKNCSFLGTSFSNCEFGNVRIDFHNCDLIFAKFFDTVFHDRSPNAFVDFDGSDLRGATFNHVKGLSRGISNGSIKITNAKHIEKAKFDDDALRAIIGRVEIFHM